MYHVVGLKSTVDKYGDTLKISMRNKRIEVANMAKISYINCIHCDHFFGFVPTDASPDGTMVVRCPQCGKDIVYRIVTTDRSVSSLNTESNNKVLTADVSAAPIADTLATELEASGAEEIK